MDERQITCISCPMGCSLTVKTDGLKAIQVTGNRCKRGVAYAESEISDPRRVVTSTIKAKNSARRTLSVKTALPIPKNKITECVKALKFIEVDAPVSVGDVIVKNICETGIDIIATCEIEQASL